MIWVGAGALALFFLLLALNRLAHASRAELGKALVMVLVVLLGIIGLLLLATGRMLMALPLLFSALMGIMRFRTLARLVGARGSWQARRKGGQTARGDTQAQGQFSSVQTEWLAMRLYHDSGDVEGVVLKGEFKDRSLRSMTQRDVLALLGVLQAEDEESTRLLEAYLDREYGAGWRKTENNEKRDASPRSSAMDKKEAREILAVADDADEATIRAAHKRLMKKLHPDRGGSSYLAARINEAKDVLLRN